MHNDQKPPSLQQAPGAQLIIEYPTGQISLLATNAPFSNTTPNTKTNTNPPAGTANKK
jgi:hypothetical protein